MKFLSIPLFFIYSLLITFMISATSPTLAHEYERNGFVLVHPFAYPSEKGDTTVAVFLRFKSITGTDRLIGAECRYADSAELRSDSDLTKPAIDHIEFSNIKNTEIDANQPHILLKGLRLPFVFMRHYDMKLIFEKAGAVDLTVSVGI